MIPTTSVLPGTGTRVMMGKVPRQAKSWRILIQTGRPVTQQDAEFGFVGALIGPGLGLVGQAGKMYTDFQMAKSAEKISKAQAQANVAIARSRADSRSAMMRTLTPVLGLLVVGGVVTAVIFAKRRRA